MLNHHLQDEREASVTPRKRLFEAGQIKLLVLHFIAQAPKFSYDIIKEVSALVGGNYKPSTGTICPNLNVLEQGGLIHAQITADERKQYVITPQGRVHLKEHRIELEKVLTHFNTRSQIQNNAEYLDIKRAMENLKTSLRLKIQHEQLTKEQIKAIANHIDQAAVQITRLANTEVSQ